MSPRKVAECGTPSGYRRHRRIGEQACTACTAANTQAQRDWAAGLRTHRNVPGSLAPALTGTLKIKVPAADGVLVAKALAHYARTLRSTRASHIAGASSQASHAERLRDELVLTLKTLKGGRS